MREGSWSEVIVLIRKLPGFIYSRGEVTPPPSELVVQEACAMIYC